MCPSVNFKREKTLEPFEEVCFFLIMMAPKQWETHHTVSASFTFCIIPISCGISDFSIPLFFLFFFNWLLIPWFSFWFCSDLYHLFSLCVSSFFHSFAYSSKYVCNRYDHSLLRYTLFDSSYYCFDKQFNNKKLKWNHGAYRKPSSILSTINSTYLPEDDVSSFCSVHFFYFLF